MYAISTCGVHIPCLVHLYSVGHAGIDVCEHTSVEVDLTFEIDIKSVSE